MALRRRELTDEEIMEMLEHDSDVEQECSDEYDDWIDVAVERIEAAEDKIVVNENRKAENVPDYEDEAEGKETEELELAVFDSDDRADLGAALCRAVDVMQAGPSVLPGKHSPEQLTKKKVIKWKTRVMAEKPDPEAYVAPKDCPELGTPFSYFKKYLDDDFFSKATYYTNKYAVQAGHSSFKPCTVGEIRILFAQHIMMSCLKLPRVRMYYDKRWNLPFFSKNMSVNRFFSLRNHLHLTDMASRPDDCKDRLFKVRPIIEKVRHQLHQLPLEENLCVDEQIIPFKGKFMAKQYIKGKPCPWGIKVYFLCGKSGMPFDFIVYQGSTTPLNQVLAKAVGSGSTIVLELAKRIPADAKGHKLYFDNYFPSFQLFELLHNRRICAAGTVRANRFGNPTLPDAKSIANRGRGSSAQCWSDKGGLSF